MVREPVQQPRRGLPDRRAARVAQPPDQARYILDAALPGSQQKLELACTGATGRAIRWFVNEQEIPASARGRTYWNLTAGEWHIRAQSGAEMAQSTITVE